MLVGCCRTHEYAYTRYPTRPFPLYEMPVYIDENFGAADKVEIVKAIEQWNYVLNGNVELKVVQEHMNPGPLELADIYHQGGLAIIKSVGGPKFKMDHDGLHILAFCDFVGGKIVYVLRDRINNWDLYWLMMHEIAHILGASHGSHLMAPTYSMEDYQCVDKTTAAQVAKFFRLEKNDLNYCYN